MAEEQQEMQEQVPMDEQGDSVPILVDRSKLTPQMRHFLTMSKMQSENAYKEEAAKVNSKNEFTKTFTDQAEYKINKAVHEATVDRNYKKGAAEAVENFKGHQNLGYDNPQMAHHAKNNEMLSNAYYKEDYEMDKDIVYFPMEASPGYVSAKKVKEATDDANYKAKAAENNQQNKLNLCETPVYQTQEALKAKVSNKAYTKDYEEAKINVHPTPVTHEMVASKKAGELTKRAYGANGMEAIRSYNNDASMLNRGDIQQAQKTQKQDDHLKREYRKDYEDSKTKYEFEKALNDVPVIKQQILASKQADATNTTYGAGGKQSMERNEFTKTYCDTNVYKTNKAITAITRDSLYQAGKADAIKSFKGFQALDINQVPSFKQHMANQENLSNVYYTDDYENDKDLVYFPTNITPKYESDKKNAEINANYKTEAAKDAETHKFNLAESETYKNQKDVESKTRPKQYTEKWEQEKFKVIGTAVTKEMELIETLKKTKDAAYTEAWDEAKLHIHYPPDNPLMLQAKKSAKQSSDIEYKKDYRENVLGAKSSADAEGDLEYVVNKNNKAITDDANYKKDAMAAMEHHKYAPEFCETEKYKIAKNITEITSDRYNTTKETLKNFQGWNTIRPGDNPLIVHHANNADQLNPYLYKEDYEVEKTLVDYPVHMSEHYQNTKNLKEKLDGYTEDYEKMKQQNRLDLTKTEKYINDEALSKNYRSDKGYKAKYEKEVQGHCIGSETNPQLEQLKALKPYQNDKLYQEGARELMKTTNVPHDAPEFELSKKRNEIRSDKFYKKNYEETKHKNIPGPVENYHDYKTQAEVKAITNDAAYKKKYNETVVTNSVTKEFCNTEQYKTNKNLKKLTSKANYSDFPETLAKYKGFQSIDTNEVPEFAMHARNADQLSQPLYKEDYNNEKDLVFFPVHMSEKYQQDKKLHKDMKDYDANYQDKKHEVNFNQAETEKYLQDKEHRAKTSDKGYKKEWSEKVQGTTVSTARTMEMDLQDTLKITKDSAYKEGAKERMKSYNRSLQDPDYEQMAKSQIQRSDKDYKKDYNENVLGKNIGAPIEGHLDYYNQKKVKEITQDSAYTADAKDRMRSFVLEPNAPFVRNAIDVQKQVNMASYRKSGKEAIDQFKGFQQLDIYKNPYLNRHIINSENLSNNYYKEEYEIDKDCVYFPYNTTEKYAADKKLHDTAGDLAYAESHKKEDWKHSMDLCATEKYQQDAKLVAENQGQRYKAKYLEDVSKGRAGGKLVHTWEIDAMNMMKKVRDQAYTAGAKQIQRKYDLMLDDNKLSHLMKVQDVCNARLYKKDYNENTLGKGAADPGIAYPYYKEQAKLTEKMQASEYTKDAKERMEKPENYVRWDELRRSRKVALQCKDSEYRKSFHEAVKSMKGFQQLDIFQNPYMSRHIVNAENASDVYYKEDYENNKDVVYFPVQITERFQDMKKIAEIEADYKTEAKKIQAKVTFDAASTEKYNADKALREKLGAEYTKNSIEINARPKGVDKTMDMERIEKLKMVQGTNYAAEAKRLAMKYGLTADDTKLANSLLSAKITSDRLYHEHYNKHVRGTTAQNPGIAYEIEVTRNKNAAKIRSDNEYQKDAKKLAQRNEFTKQKYSESEKARLVALQCNDSEYQKGKREAVNEFKGYMRMDASLHPVVTRGILVSEMQSAALYREDWEMEKDLIYYPLNMTPGYEQLKAADEYKSDANYRAKWEQDKIATKYNAALTEKYNNDLEIRKVQSDAFYRSEWNSKQRHEFKTPARTMEMDRFEPLRKLTNKAYALEAKKLGEKYGLVHDDITLRNLMAVGGITSQIAYKKAYNAEDLGKSSKADFYGYLPYVTQRDVKAATNDAAYTKDAKNIMKHNVVAQSNEELRARSVALSMKDSEYKKSMREAIETCKGFMRMDAHLHPVVQRGVAVNEIISDALYKEEWELEKDAIYFPVQMTPGYETAITSTKQSSDIVYKSDYNASKHQNKYDPTVSEKYQSDKVVENARSDKTYRKDYEETKHQNIGIAVTSEMERAGIQRDLRDAKYSLEAKNLAMKYGLTHDDIKLKNLLAVGAICSERLYKDHYNKEVLGKSSKADLNGYPHIKDSFKLQKEMSKAQYEKKSKEILKKNNYAQFDDEIRARNMALSVKDSAYRSSMWKAIDEFKGFMRMDASSHPVVTRGILVAELMSDALYKEDYMLERDLIYYPVQITPGYESATNAQNFASDINYRAKYHETKAENKYNSTLDQRYAEIKTHEKARSDKTYKADYEATKHIAKGTPVTQEMERAAIMKEISDDKYKAEAKKLAMKYGLTCDDIKLANSLAVAKIASDKLYKKDYNENVLGASGKADLQGYPVYKDAKENNAKLNTKAYKKDAMKVLEKNNYAQFDDEIRAREVALYCNPDRYSQQRREVINDMKGFMRMDAAMHPVVTRGIEVAEMQSAALYREEWEIEKDLIYFPAQITPGYESAQDAYKFQSENLYRKKYKDDLENAPVFNPVHTEKYQQDKETEKHRSDKHYKAKWDDMKEKGQGFSSVPVTMEMERAKLLEKTAMKIYGKEAKNVAMKYGLDAQDVTLTNLKNVQQLRSDILYKKKYIEEDLGKSSVADLKGYPHLEASNKLQKAMSKAEYEKDAKQCLTKNNYVQFDEQNRAEKMAYEVRGSNYRRQMWETINKYKGFQRMDAASHPIVAEGNRVNDIISQRNYIEDYLIDRNVIYYPVHMTPGYEAAMFAAKWQSNIEYDADYQENKMKNKFNMTETERYKDIQVTEQFRSDKNYQAKVKADFSAGKGLTSIKETPEMVISKALKPLRTEYMKEAKDLAAKYSLCAGAVEIAHALEVADVTSMALYKKDYNENTLGKAAANPGIAYPFYDLCKEYQSQRSDKNYKGDLQKVHDKYTFMDSDECRRARAAALSCTPREYTKQREEVIKKYQGFQRMDAATHPIVLEGERVNNLISKARYLEDFIIEKESVFYPVHLTAGYENSINAQKLLSETEYKKDHEANKFKNVYDSSKTEKYAADKVHEKHRSDFYYKLEANKMFSEGKGFTEVAERFDINLSKELQKTQGDRYVKEAKEIAGKYGLAHDAMAITSAIAISDVISKKLYKKKYEEECLGTGAKNPAIAHPEYLHYRDVQAALNQSNYKAEGDKIKVKYTVAESNETLRARSVALQCTDKEYKKQRAEVINKYKGFQHMDAHNHPVVVEGERVNDIISHSKYIEDYLVERNFVYFPAHITPGYENAVAVNKFQSDIPYRKDYLENRAKNVYDVTTTERYADQKAAVKYKNDQYYAEEWNTTGKLKFTPVSDTPVQNLAKANSKLQRPNDYVADAKDIMSKYGLELQNLNLQESMKNGQHHKDYLYKEKYNKETKGKGGNYKGIDDVFDYKRAKENQFNLNEKNYRATGEEFNHKYTLVYDTPVQLTALKNQKNINHALYSKSKIEAIEKFKGFQRMDAATHPIVVEGERVNDVISHRKYIEDYLIDRNVIYYPVHMTPGYETAMYASKWQSNIGYTDEYQKSKVKNVYNQAESEQYKDAKARQAAIGQNAYGREWKDKLATSKQHTEIVDPTEVKLAKSVKPWIGKAAYIKAAKEIAAKHGLVAGDISLQHAAECKLKLSMKDYRQAYVESVQGVGGKYQSIDDLFIEKQAKLTQEQLSQKNYTAKDDASLHQYTVIPDSIEMQRVKAQAGLLNDYLYSASRRDCIARYKGFQNMDAHSHPVVIRGVEAMERISNSKYTEEWKEIKEMIYFPVQITPAYESAMQAYQFQSQLLYNKDYHKEKHNNVYNMCTSEGYAQKQTANKILSDHHYQEDYRKNKGKGFTEVMTLKEETAKSVQPQTSIRLYQQAAKDLMGKYHIDCTAMEVGHAMEMRNVCSQRIYDDVYNKEVKGLPSRFFHLTETYDTYKKNAINLNDKIYQQDGRAASHQYTFGPNLMLEHYKNVMKLMSTSDYTKSQKIVNNTFKAFSKLCVGDDMNMVRAAENARNLSDWRYKEEYLEERNYAYFPVHITPGYENALQHTKMMSDKKYKAEYEESKRKANHFRANETEHYIQNKDLDGFLSIHKYRAKYMADRNKGYKGVKGLDMVQENLRDCQKRLSNWTYEQEARNTMGKYNLDLDFMPFKLAKANDVIQSENLYRKAGKEFNTKYQSAGKDEFALQLHAANKKLQNPNNYAADWNKQKEKYTLIPDSVAVEGAKAASKAFSQKEYLKDYEAAVKSASSFKNIDMWPEDRFHSEVTRNMSKHAYQEEYLIDRECCFYPVHITPGYELSLEVNRFQSQWLYLQKYKKDIQGAPNKYKITESEKYSQDKKNKGLLDFKYQEAGKAANTKWQFTIITPVHEHQKAMIELGSESKYKKEAKEVMMKYDLPVQRIDIVAAKEARQMVSDYIYLTKHREEKGKSRLWNAAAALDGPRHKENQQNVSEKGYKEAAEKMKTTFNIPVDHLPIKAAQEAAAACSNLDYKKTYQEAIKQCRAFTKLSIKDSLTQTFHQDVKEILSDKKYKEEYMEEQVGWCIPEFDTPEYRRIKEQYDRGDVSDKLYKKTFYKNTFGKGLTDFTGPSFQHALNMKTEQSKISYEAKDKEKHKWASHMANQTPGAMELKEAQKYQSASSYKQPEHYMGIGAAVMSEETKNQLEVQHLASVNEYKQKYEETKHISDFAKCEEPIDMAAFKDAQKLQSDNLYKAQHLKEDFGRPAELAMSVKLVQDRENQKLASEHPYKLKGEKAKHIQSYQNNLFLTPWAKYVEEMKHLVSDNKYKEEWNDEKSAIWVPYMWTVEYEHYKEQADLKNQRAYTGDAKKALSKTANLYQSVEHEFQKEVKKEISTINYGNKVKGVMQHGPHTTVADTPAILHAKEAQELASGQKYKAEAEVFNKFCALDPTGGSYVSNAHLVEATKLAKDANVVKLDQTYDLKATPIELKDDFKTQELLRAQKMVGGKDYKKEAIAEMHAVNGCSVTDTPWQLTVDNAQKYASETQYREDPSKMKIFDDGTHDIQKYADRQANVSDVKYREEYNDYWKGQVLSLPIPFDLTMESLCERQKLTDDKAYKEKAKEAAQKYLVVPDTPYYRHLKELAEKSGERTYKAAALHEMRAMNLNTADSFSINEVKKAEALKSNREYQREAKLEMSLNSQTVNKETAAQIEATKVSDKIGYYKDGKEAMKSNLQADKTLEQAHIKDTVEKLNDRNYKAAAKVEMHAVNCNTIGVQLNAAKDAQKLTDEKGYKEIALKDMQSTNIRDADNFVFNNVKQIQKAVSDVEYKNSDQFGGIKDNEWCFQFPDDLSLTSAQQTTKYQSDAAYKKQFNEQKGKVAFIAADTPEYARLQKMQEQYSDLKYRDQVKREMKDITFTPNLKEATKASEIASDVKYRKAGKTELQKNTQVKDMIVDHQASITKDTLRSDRDYKQQYEMEKSKFTALPDDIQTTHRSRVQKIASKIAYQQENKMSEYSKLERTYDQERHDDNQYLVSSKYKQKTEGKSLDMVPSMEAKLEFQTLASKIEYSKNKQQDKNSFKPESTPMYNQLKDLKSIQSDVQYKKKAREGMDKNHATSIEDRPDIAQNATASKLVSDKAYKEAGKQGSSGYTFVPEAPIHQHHNHAGKINSELHYKREGLKSQKGKGWEADEANPFQQTYMEAQRFTSGRNYKTAARDAMKASCYEDDFNSERVKKASRILSDREYKKDFEKTMKGYGYDLHMTPAMEAIRKANAIKSDKEYKKQYESELKGRSAGDVLQTPAMKAAMAAQQLMKKESLGEAIAGNDKWVTARVNAILDTPEMRRIKGVAKTSERNYRIKVNPGATVLDTPEMRRVKNVSKIQSKVGYADNKWKGKSCGVMDTPEMRMVKRNQKNFSELKYKEDLQKQAGKRIQVADDLATKRARRATDIASDLNYKGIRGKVDQMEAARMTLENEARQQQIRSQAPAQSTGTRVGRAMPRYRADPGSVFDIEDPTDIEYGSSYNHHYDTADDMDGDGSDYELLANWDPKKVGEQTSSWKSYLTGSYKRAYAPGHVMKYQEGETQQALQNVGYESSFYGGSNMQTPAPVQEEQVEFISVRALYDYTAADDDEVSFQEGDIISQAQEIGGGWLFGVVERTGASGMLPGNYVQQI